MYNDMEYLVRINEPLEELLVVDRGPLPGALLGSRLRTPGIPCRCTSACGALLKVHITSVIFRVYGRRVIAWNQGLGWCEALSKADISLSCLGFGTLGFRTLGVRSDRMEPAHDPLPAAHLGKR